MKTAVVLACDDNFIAYTSITARNIAASTTEHFPIFVLSDGVTDENKALARKFCPWIEFIELRGTVRDMPFNAEFPPAASARLFLDQVLPDLERALYLDSDISLLTDISPLLAMKPKVAPVIAAYDIPQMIEGRFRQRLPMSASSGYFNSGVMMLDLTAFRQEQVFREALLFLKRKSVAEYPDQDALNVALNGRWQVLDWRWNVLHHNVECMPKPHYLRHITGNKPWAWDKTGVERYIIERWRSDLAASPWPDRYFYEPSSLRRKRFRRALTRPMVDFLGLTPSGRRPANDLYFEYTNLVPSILDNIDDLFRNQRLGSALYV
ncbi:glycosyltransferase family 8 protein [Mesorhizobium sp. VNQ89]|uniref:glycosyltransferase family 8 protein n=1 Tax=Mesorhizobium quangtriensis TaxID=3157709 RepID=UPI0032B82FB1